LLSSNTSLRLGLVFLIPFLGICACNKNHAAPSEQEYSAINTSLAYFVNPSWEKANAGSPVPVQCYVETNFLPLSRELADVVRYHLQQLAAPRAPLAALSDLLLKEPSGESPNQLKPPGSCAAISGSYAPTVGNYLLLQSSRVGFDPDEEYGIVILHTWVQHNPGFGSGAESMLVLRRDGSSWRVTADRQIVAEN